MGNVKPFSSLSVRCLFSVVLFLHAFNRVTALTVEEDLEIERRLGIINKHPVKTIKTIHGEVIDCVDIYKQPAFDHPLLKGHKIQRKPSQLPERATIVASNRSMHLDGFTGIFQVDCPYETVPIRRTTKDDLIREKLLERSRAVDDIEPDETDEWVDDKMAILKLKDAKTYLGGTATINLQNPRIRNGEASGARVWLSAGPNGEINRISAGWVVSPTLYGDDRTHFSIQFTGDGNKGCYDTRCPGFVLTSGATLGVAFPNTSVYEGQQWDINVFIYQDTQTKNWWLAVGDDNEPVGYWPKELLPKLTDGATDLSFGGYTSPIPNQPAPPMGSGVYLDDCNFGHASYFRLVKYKSVENVMLPAHSTLTRIDCPGYGLQYGCTIRADFVFAFLYGGPGGQC